ncbi:FeoA family protein [Desulfofarcimen acetoxidans DSM 771]|jgi:ferrous iron transport protein A|uniref:FeoA family protein n=1 Tax=Desulfofarcimen acetoxidans (strain ATCC 49208 / DSM 771 / KCTC 5769 / VKM B-1644 / 5575) TaxID=485916 RepID=C8VXE5_DESAS|nr:FeoA family protein [Desulfofarcimen acetoxidans]ACV64541.1 FeoA family protein [Desulfofarcimen acetoxidans DSM 771]
MKDRQKNPNNKNIITLHDLPIGKMGIVSSIKAEGISRRRMLDLGLVPGTKVEALRISPMGDPKAYKIRGAVIAFREEEGTKILVKL